jgi:hypothetical protein
VQPEPIFTYDSCSILRPKKLTTLPAFRARRIGRADNLRYVRLNYQPPASSTSLSGKTTPVISHQAAGSCFLSEQIIISHQPTEQAVDRPNNGHFV